MKFGKIQSYNSSKKIGYIISDSDETKIFFRKSDTNKPFNINDKVLYEESENSLGKIALKINILNSNEEQKEESAIIEKLETKSKKNQNSKAVITSI